MSTSVSATAAERDGATDLAPAERSPAADRRRRRLVLLAPWVLVPLAVGLAYLVLPPPSDMRSQYQASAVALVSAPAVAWLLTRRTALAHHSAAALVATLLPGLTLISLHGTDWYFSGPFGDQSFRMEYATRFADDLSLQDYTYRDVPAFYSPGWFWVVGAVSKITGTPGWQTYKWVGIASLYVAVVLAFLLWRRTCDTRLAAVMVTATTIGLPAADASWLGGETLLFSGAYEPYAWLVVLPLPALLTWLVAGGDRFSWRRGVALGAALAVAAWLYVLYALVAAIAVVLVTAWRWRDRARLVETAVAAGTAMVLVSPWLGPFLVEWLAAGTPPALATTYVNEDSYVRLVGSAATPWFALALVGAVGLLALRGERERPLLGLQALAATVVLLGLVQAVLGQAARGVLFHRMLIVLGVCLLAAAVLVLAAVGPALLARVRDVGPRVPLGRLAFGALTVLLFLNVSAHGREWMSLDADLRKLAHDVPYPDGTFPALVSPQTVEDLEDEVPVTDLATAIRDTAREAGQEEVGVVLTDNMALLATQPFHGYLQWWGLYSNPLGDYPGRRDFLEGLAGAPAEELVDRLRADPDAPTVFALQVDDGEATFGSEDWDPGGDDGGPWSVTFPTEVFDDEDFVTVRVDDWLVASLREG